jgi:ankyrin repeat protein
MFINEDKLRFLDCNSFEDLQSFLENYDINEIDDFGNNILHYFLTNIKTFNVAWNDVIPEILNKGLDINVKQNKGAFKRSPLHIAVLIKSKEITDYLIDKGADINSTDANGNSILSTAVMRYWTDRDGYFIEKLIQCGADPFKENNYGHSAYSSACSIDNSDVGKFFEHLKGK